MSFRAARTEARERGRGGAAVGKAGQVGDEEMHQNGKRKKSHAQVQSQEFQQAGIVAMPQPPIKTGAKLRPDMRNAMIRRERVPLAFVFSS